MRVLVSIALVLIASAASAGAPDTSLRPVARTAPAPAETGEREGLFRSLRPMLRSREARRQARETERLAKKGSVCGDIAIQGVEIGKVPGKIRGCGIDNAVKILSIGGVTLSQQAMIDCSTARTLKAWIETGMKPVVGNQGGGAARLRIAAHYACRSRNSKKGARISEHGKGRAIDISGLVLRDGSEISVLRDWGRGKKGRILKQLRNSACGPFGTVLGPGSDGHHRDHFHFDTARHRSGSYCR